MAGAIDPIIGNMQCGTDDSLSCRLIRAIKNCRNQSTSTDDIMELIGLGADINKGDDNNVTPIHWAVKNNNIECVKLLLLHGVNVNVSNNKKQTPLHLAVHCNNVEYVKLLVHHGAETNRCDSYNATPLYWAARNNDLECVKLLLQHGADSNICDKDYESPLYQAARNDNTECVQLLLQQGADTNICNKDYETPLYQAALNNNTQCVQLLLQHGADVDVLDTYYDAPLNLAVRYCHLEIIKILLEYNANVNNINLHGRTHLIQAALNVSKSNTEENMTCLELLIQASGQFDLRNKNGELIPDIARDNELSEMLLPYCVHPRSLQALCRYQIRLSLHHQFLPDVIPSLNLPKTVQRFVLLQ